MSDAQMLQLVECAIQKRLQGDAYNGYVEGVDRFDGETLDNLFRIRERLQRLIASAGNPMFRPFAPVRE